MTAGLSLNGQQNRHTKLNKCAASGKLEAVFCAARPTRSELHFLVVLERCFEFGIGESLVPENVPPENP